MRNVSKRARQAALTPRLACRLDRQHRCKRTAGEGTVCAGHDGAQPEAHRELSGSAEAEAGGSLRAHEERGGGLRNVMKPQSNVSVTVARAYSKHVVLLGTYHR